MNDRIYRFGEFQLSLADGELRSSHSTVRLQDKPLRLLAELLDHAPRLVTRERLRERLWDSRTVVDYEQGINVAVKKVRDALGESADDPKFIATVAKRGYRFLAAVEVISPDTAPSPLVDMPTGTGEPGTERRARRRWLLPTIAAGVLCVIGLAFFEIQIRPRHTATIHSLAVLPLRDLSADARQEYFADGITEELITNLAQTLPLRVISRTSIMKYKRTEQPMTRIAQELGADVIVEGAVVRSGDRVRVTVQLIDATEDRHLWARTYERRFEDILETEAELSHAIASQVGSTLSLRQIKPTTLRPVDPQVHELWLMGRHHLNERTAADFAKAEEYFQQAVARDPQYAPAYAGLADVYALRPNFAAAAVLDSFTKSVAAARHALELDDTLAEAHATLGLVGVNLNPDWKTTEPEFRRAIELNPNYAMAHLWFAFYLFFAERRSEALAEVELARQLDPLSAIINADAGRFLYAMRHFDEARARLRRAIELEPQLGRSHTMLALIELESGHTAGALQEARAGLALDPDNPCTIGEAGYVLAVTGQTAAAEKLLATLEDLDHHGSSFPSFTAMVEIGLGQRDRALATLKEMAQSRIGAGLHGLGQWHAFDEISTDPRYRELLAQAR